ncbi:hypothetical protein LUZ63_017789 [Rhynchospora breviuscula]|uniref:Uncharacterized protein n=1 Tax=Rhynchospora breviuscula TaxID=2022672 RepID=A0A9Q0HGY5_9POAL|nr:hypothetical protein LUZ63_017789 [Rhynchospora breviuscula]
MLQILFAVAFSAAPLTLYVPPVRSLNLFVQSIEVMVRESEPVSRRTFFRLRLGLRRIFARLSRAFR